MKIPLSKNSYHMQASSALKIYMAHVFSESYFQTQINLIFNLLFLVFLKFRKIYFQGTAVSGSKGVNFVPVNIENPRTTSFGVLIVSFELNEHLFLVFCG